MNRKIRFITETAVMLALLIALQWAGGLIPEPLTKQLVTGSFVNCVLGVTVLVAGLHSGIVVALISPVFAFLFHIAPVMIAVPVIMLGNLCYVLLLGLLLGKNTKPVWKQPVTLAAAAAVKFGVLYLLGVKLVCGVLAEPLNGKVLLGSVVMAPKIVRQLMNMFAWPQLATALMGGTVALLVVPVLRKALHRG